MLAPGNTSPCHLSLHLFAKRRESQHAGIAQQLSDRALRGNRLLVTALAVVGITTVGIGWFTFPTTPQLTGYGEANPRNSEYRPGGSACQPKALASITDRTQRLSKADACAKEAEEYRQQTADLIQQTRAADAANAQAQIASQKLWTGWLQTLGGFLTLAAAVGAAIYARDAAKESGKQAEIAGNNLTALKKLEQPIIKVKFAEGYPKFFKENGGLYIRFRIALENTGRSTAFIRKICIMNGTTNYYTFYVDPGTQESPNLSEKQLLEGSDIFGYIEYSYPLETDIRSVFRLDITIKDQPGMCKAVIRPSSLLRKGHERYDEPFQKHIIASTTEAL